MNTTPRTDAAVSNGYRFTQDGGVREYVPADFARQLETELTAANALLREAKQRIKSWGDRADARDRHVCDRIAAHLEASK